MILFVPVFILQQVEYDEIDLMLDYQPKVEMRLILCTCSRNLTTVAQIPHIYITNVWQNKGEKQQI